MVFVVVLQLHVESRRPPGHLPADVSHADEAQGLALQLEHVDLPVLLLLPSAGFDVVGIEHHPPVSGQHEHQRMLGHRHPVGPTVIRHRDA